MWVVVLLLAYISLVVSNHASTGRKHTELLLDRISSLKYEIMEIKNKPTNHNKYSDEHYTKLCDRFNDVQDTVNKIKTVGEANHRWIMANHTLISKTYRLSEATDSRAHSVALDLVHCIDGFSEHWVNEESWQECTDIIRKNGFDAADSFIKKVSE
jgi:hypothetical protein